MRADCAQGYQLQPLLAGFCFCGLAPPAPDVPPLHPLLELPAVDLSPVLVLLSVTQPLIVNADPVIRLAMQKPAKIFFRSFASIIVS